LRQRTLILYRFTSEIVARLFSLGVVLLAARLLTKQEFGLFSLAWVAGWMLAVAGDFGIQVFLAREVAGRPAGAGLVLRRLLKVRLAAGAGLLFSAALLLHLWKTPAAGGLFLILLAQTGTSLVDFINHLYRGLSRSELESSVNLIHRGLTLLAAWILLQAQATLVSLALAMLSATAVALLGTGLLAARVCPPVQPPVAGRTLAPSLREIAGQVLPIGAGILLSELYFRIDLFLIDWWRGKEAVASYAAVFRIFESVKLLPAAVMAVVFPELCRARTLRPALRIGGWLTGLGTAIFLLAVWPSEWIVELLFGAPYMDAAPAFRLLLAAVPLLYFNFVLTHQLIGWRLQRPYAIVCAAGLVANFALNVVLIPEWGIQGAAGATILTEMLLLGGWSWAVVRMSRGVVRSGETLEQ
jgi:O-antigen/teichoic acid export membrane protein